MLLIYSYTSFCFFLMHMFFSIQKYPNLHVLKSNHQIKCLQTLIRDRTTHREDFIFYSDRLIRLLIEEGLNFLPFSEKVVTTPTGVQYHGTLFATKVKSQSLRDILFILFITDMWSINRESRRKHGGWIASCLQTH